MTMLNINLVDKTIIGPIEISSVETAKVAIDAIKGAVEILWKGAFAGEAAPSVAAPASAREERRMRKVPTGEPKEGSYDAGVLAVVRRLGLRDQQAIAAEMNEPKIKIALALGRLNKRGCFKGSEA